MNRQTNLSRLKSESFDLLIIGGGVTGAGIALDAASRGLKTALVEKEDFASGTSSRSTKLVHGGLRYLKQLDIGLVMEVGRERAIVHQNAPHLVIPERMLLPIVRGGTYGKLASNVGLAVYDFLAGVRKVDRRKMLSRRQTLATEPLLDPARVRGAGLYSEYRTDDARLTIELIKTASRYGAVCVNYCRLYDFEYRDGMISGGQCRDELSGEPLLVRAGVVVNAAGPWVDDVRKINRSITAKRLHLTKGVHLVVDGSRFPVRHSIYFDVPDGRMIFAIPRLGKTYIGTTDTDYHEDKEHVVCTREDAEYLLKAVNDFFPGLELEPVDVESTWAGLRPLIHQEGKSASEISRKDEMFEWPDGLLSIAGGKLTGYRVMARKTVDRAVKRLQVAGDRLQVAGCRLQVGPCITRGIRLAEDPLTDESEVAAFRKEILGRIQAVGLPVMTADYLVANYGRTALRILERTSAFEPAPAAERLVRAELAHCYEHEMVVTLVDFFDRRTGRLSFDLNSVKDYRAVISEDLGTLFDWSPGHKKEEIERLDGRILEVTNSVRI